MNTIERSHNFQHRMTRIWLEDGYFFMYSEGQKVNERRVKATERGLRAFLDENWPYFEALEESAL